MKAIVVRQPWATLIALGIKTIETRPAPPNGPMRPEGVRGLPGLPLERGERIAIVAGKARPKRGWATVDARHLVGRNDDGEWVLAYPDRHEPLPLGSVVCLIRVDDALPIMGRDDELTEAWRHHIAPTHREPLALWRTAQRENFDTYWSVTDITDQRPLGDYEPGRWGWMLSDPQALEVPIPTQGRQGVFELGTEVSQALEGGR